MKLIAAAFLIASLVQSALPQSTAAPSDVHPVESKQDKKEQLAKAKTQKKAEKSQTSDKSKKTTTSQDAAYAAAYKAGIPK
jgi:hypothetical protein